MSDKSTCSACGGAEHLRGSMWHGDSAICKPCFMVWYDPDEDIDQTNPEAVGALSLKLKAQGKFPWVGEYAPKCPKCGVVSGDDWSQCDGPCPMPMSPYYQAQ